MSFRTSAGAATCGIVITWLVTGTSGARTWTLFPDGTGDAPTLQAAADSTSPGDTVAVTPGSYPGPAVFTTSDVTLIGTGAPGAATVDASGSTLCVGASANMLIEGLRFVGTSGGAYGFDGAAVAAGYVEIEVRDCIFENSHAALVTSGSAAVRDCEIRNGFGVLWRGFFVSSPYLLMERCLFEGNQGGSHFGEGSIVQVDCEAACPPGSQLTVQDCVFRNNVTPSPERPVIGYQIFSSGLSVRVESNLFVGNSGPAFGLNPLSIVAGRRAGAPPDVEFRGNTIAKSVGFSLGTTDNDTGVVEGGVFDANVVTGGQVGIVLPADLAGLTVTCNNAWANAQNWVGHDLTGTDANVSVAPKYCDPGAGDFTVASNSPLLPGNNACGVQIGAFGQGCGPISVETRSWGWIKAEYRD
jgi:hypothetical protein